MTASSLPRARTPRARIPRASFTGALRGELHKLRCLHSTWVVVGLGLLFLALFMTVAGTETSFRHLFTSRPLVGFKDFLQPLEAFFAAGAGIALLLAGSRLVGMEYQLGTIRLLLARGTGRWQLLLAKIAALCIFGLALLVGYAVLAAAGTSVVVLHQTGGLAPLESLPASAWDDAGLAAGFCAISVASCVLLAACLATLWRSQSGGMILAVVFFPVDNALSVGLAQVSRLTGSPIWKDVTALLFGPSLNRLPNLLQVQPSGTVSGLPQPQVATSLEQTGLVIAAWWVLLLLLALTSLARRDVLS
ncbi:MAG: ABC transporter permease [Candidatus Dormibacteria bacterium]